MENEMKCECFGVEDSAGVVSSALGPFSCSYCGSCLANNVEPLFAFEATYEIIGKDVAEHVKAMNTIIDGYLVSWSKFVEMKESDHAS